MALPPKKPVRPGPVGGYRSHGMKSHGGAGKVAKAAGRLSMAGAASLRGVTNATPQTAKAEVDDTPAQNAERLVIRPGEGD